MIMYQDLARSVGFRYRRRFAQVSGIWRAFQPKKKLSRPEIGIKFSSHFLQNQCQLTNFFYEKNTPKKELILPTDLT